MLYIIITLGIFLGVVGMARRRRSRRRSLVPIKFSTSIMLGALVSATVISTPTVDSLEQDFDIVSTDLTCVLRNHTAGEGPIDFGL